MPYTNFQNPVDFSNQKFYVGLDVHKKSWTVTIRSSGMELRTFTQPPKVEQLSCYLNKHFPGGRYFSAYEAGFCGTGIHERLCKLGVENILIHAADMPSTDKQKKNKTDLHDSRAIAENLERGTLKGIYVLTREQQELRSLFRLRECKVKDVTQANNRLKSFLLYFGIELPSNVLKKEYLSLQALNWLANLELATVAGSMALRQYIEELKYQRKQLYLITKQLREQIQTTASRPYQCLLSVPGIGAVTAMGLIAEVVDFGRFNDPDQYSSFLGLCPRENSSGESTRTMGVQPRCNRHLRPLLIEASWTAIRRSSALFAYYCRHNGRNSKQAIIKVARKVAMIAKGVVTSGQLYQDDYVQGRQGKLIGNKPSKTKRFSSGIKEKHSDKEPGIRSIPMPD
jgi:transposase